MSSFFCRGFRVDIIYNRDIRIRELNGEDMYDIPHKQQAFVSVLKPEKVMAWGGNGRQPVAHLLLSHQTNDLS